MIGRTYTTSKGHLYSVSSERNGREVMECDDGNYYTKLGLLDEGKIEILVEADGNISFIEKDTKRLLDGELESRLEKEPRTGLRIVCRRTDRKGNIISPNHAGNGIFVTAKIVEIGQR